MSEKRSLQSSEVQITKEKSGTAGTLGEKAHADRTIASNIDKLSLSTTNDKKSIKSTDKYKDTVNGGRRRKHTTSRSTIDEDVDALSRGLGKMGLDPSMENRDEEGWLLSTADPPKPPDFQALHGLDWDSPGILYTDELPCEHDPSLGIPITDSQDEPWVLEYVEKQIEDDDTELRPLEWEMRQPRSGICE